MSLKAPAKSPRLPRRPPARRRRRPPPPSSRRGGPRILRQRSRRSLRWPKPSSVAMADTRQQSRKKRSDRVTDDAAPVAADTAAAENLLIFRLAGESFGLRLATVAEIIRLRYLSHMPLVPPSLLGLANLRGVVLPVVSLRALLHLPNLAADESTRVVVM